MIDEECYYPRPLEIELTTIHRGENRDEIRGVKIRHEGTYLGSKPQLHHQEGIWWDDRDAIKAYEMLKTVASMYNKLLGEYEKLKKDD
jgi:hypothetical protein